MSNQLPEGMTRKVLDEHIFQRCKYCNRLILCSNGDLGMHYCPERRELDGAQDSC